MTPTELAAILSAIATMIAALGYNAFKSGKKESPLSYTSVATTKDVEALADLLKAALEENRDSARDTRDRLVRLEERISIARAFQRD